jgi:hypothetical protein
VDDPRERHLPNAGWVDLEDAETGRRVLVDSGSRLARAQLSQLAERRVRDRARALNAAGVDVVSLNTGQDYGVPLRQAFARRARRIAN